MPTRVGSGRTARSEGGSVYVQGAINAAQVHAGRDVEVRGPLTNRRKGWCTAGADIRAQLVDNSLLFARGNVQVAKEVVQSDLFACGSIQATALRGGITVATGGVDIKTLGSPAWVRTLVVAGYDWMLPVILKPVLSAAAELAEDLKRRLEAVGTLRANSKRLTNQQKEDLTELEFVLAEQADKLKDVQARIDEVRRLSAERSLAVVKVRGEVYPGVELRLGNLSTTTAMRMAGPVSFQVLGSGSQAVIAAVEEGTRPMPLPSRRLPDPMAGIAPPS